MNRAAFAPTAVAATARESAANPVVPTFLMYSFPALYLAFWSPVAASSLSPACSLPPGPRSLLVAFVAALSLSPPHTPERNNHLQLPRRLPRNTRGKGLLHLLLAADTVFHSPPASPTASSSQEPVPDLLGICTWNLDFSRPHTGLILLVVFFFWFWHSPRTGHFAGLVCSGSVLMICLSSPPLK